MSSGNFNNFKSSFFRSSRDGTLNWQEWGKLVGQCFGSWFTESKSRSRLLVIPDPDLESRIKFKTITVDNILQFKNKIKFLDQNMKYFNSQASMKGYRRMPQPQRTSNTSIHVIPSYFPFLWVIFTFQDSDPNPQTPFGSGTNSKNCSWQMSFQDVIKTLLTWC